MSNTYLFPPDENWNPSEKQKEDTQTQLIIDSLMFTLGMLAWTDPRVLLNATEYDQLIPAQNVEVVDGNSYLCSETYENKTGLLNS